MNRIQKAAVLACLVDRLRENGSWTGETHLQKGVFFLQELLGVPLGFDFMLYKHGPFSFDLRDELTTLRADYILELEVQSPPYGPKFRTTESGREIKRRHPKTLATYGAQIDFVATVLGNNGVAELERLATALYVTLEEDTSVADRARRLHEAKPHVSNNEAFEAVERLDGIRQQARNLSLAS